MSTISTTVSHAIQLGGSTYYSPLTIATTGAVETTVVSFAAIFGPNTGGPWSVLNKGTVESTNGDGISFSRGFGGVVSNHGEVTGASNGIYIYGQTGSVSNLGTVDSTGTLYSAGVYVIATYENVTNGSHSHNSALIESDWNGVDIRGFGRFTNYGTVESIGTHPGPLGFLGSAVFMPRGGYVLNHGLLEADGRAVYIGGNRGTQNQGALGTVNNFGTIESSGQDAVALVAGGYVTNSGTVESTAFDGVYFSGAPGRLTNLGTVETTASYQSGVYLDAGGIVVNGSHGKTLGSIDGQWIAAGFASGGTLVNYGTVDSLGTAFGSLGKGGFGVFMPKGGDIYNFGQIEADEFTAVYAGGSAGTPNSGTRGTLHNSGTITSTAEGAVDFAEGGVVFNGKVNKTTALLQAGSNAAAVYMGGSQGTLNSGAAGTVTNFATIETTTTLHSGVELVAGGKVKNIDTYALIEGGLNGVSIGGSGSGSSVISGGVVNYGTIEGTLGAGITLSAGGSVTNSGFVEGYIGVQISGGDATLVDAGTIKGTGSLAVSLTGTGAPLLVVDPGAVFVGTVVGHGSSSTLELANGRQLGTLSGIGSSFQSFGAIKIDPNANWVLSGDASASTLTNDGKILVHDSQTFVFGGVDEDEKAHGKIVLATSGAAEFKAAVASGQSLVFRDATGFLKLDDLSGFAAKMEGFRKGDTIDLANITATSVSFSKGQLAIINSGSTIATLALKGRYTSKEFVVTQVGTDTKITIGAPPPTMPVFVYADPDWHGGGRVFFAERGLLYSGGGGRGELLPFGASASIGAGVADPNPLLPWSADPFHFWTIQG